MIAAPRGIRRASRAVGGDLQRFAFYFIPAAFLALATPLGAAAQAANAAPAPAAAAPAAAAPADVPDSPWTKVCATDPSTKKQLCMVIQELHAETGQFIASATIRQLTGDPKIAFIAAVPPGMLIQPGLTATVDGGKPFAVKFGICLPQACYGELDVDDSFVTALRNGSKFVLTTQNQGAKGVNFPMSLAGFGKVYDSKGIDGQSYAQRQEQLNKGVQAKNDDFRKKLIEEQQKQAGAPAPAN